MRRALAFIGLAILLPVMGFLVWVYGFGRVVEDRAAEEVPVVERPASRERGVEAGALMIPVLGITPEALTNTFAESRAAGARRHDAIDIMAAEGTPIVAAAPGFVERLFRSDDGGNTIYVRSHDRRLIYYYAHLDRYALGLREGARVVAGTPLGTVGLTGNADPSAPHLHFAVHRMSRNDGWWEGRAINPYPMLTDPN